MKVSRRILGTIMTDLAATKLRRSAFERVMEVRPETLSFNFGSWYDGIKPWKKNVDEFDRRLLGIDCKRGLGLHFSSAGWEIPVEQYPSLDALRAGRYGELYYYAVDPKAGAPKFLNQFPGWCNSGRNHLIVIDRELKAVKEIEGNRPGPEPLTQVMINAPAYSTIYDRSVWLIKKPIPLYSSRDLHRPTIMKKFEIFASVYQFMWQRELKKTEALNFYIMLFSVANGLNFLDALTALANPASTLT